MDFLNHKYKLYQKLIIIHDKKSKKVEIIRIHDDISNHYYLLYWIGEENFFWLRENMIVLDDMNQPINHIDDIR